MRDELLSLLHCPTNYRTSFSGYVTNGYRFHTHSRKKNLQTQNSGVFVLGNMGAGTENKDYYGISRVCQVRIYGRQSCRAVSM